jgi:uncharacterized protein YggE
VRWMIVSVVLVGVIGIAALAQAQAQGQPEQGGRNQIVTSGNGQVTVTPDQATLSVGAQAQRPTAAEAMAEVNRAATQIIGRWQQLGIRREDVQTASIQVFPVYNTPREGAQPQVTGYRAFYGLAVMVRDLNLVGRAVDAAVAGGANAIQGVTFGLRETARARNEALAMAVREAREKAEAIAGAAGLRIRGIERIVEAGEGVAVREQRLAPAAVAQTPIEPGTLTVTARVTVVFGY